MRVGLMQEGHCPPGVSWSDRLHEMLIEAKLAEDTGWDWYGVGEQHFAREDAATVSAPEIFHAALARETSRIRLRPMSTNLIRYNHPIRIAEQIATLDVLSNGRAELGGARSNNPFTLEAFGVDPQETRAQRNEALQILGTAWRNREFEHHGEIYDIPLRTLAPRPVQSPTPPVHISATGVESHTAAGTMGIGVMTGNSILGWEFLQSCIDAYKDSIQRCGDPVLGWVNNRLAFSSIGVACAATREEAIEIGGPVALQFVDVVIRFNSILARQSPDYAYLGQVEKLEAHRDDLDYLMSTRPYITIGTPDDLIARATEVHARGADDLIYRLDGMGHKENLRAIEMIGRHVLPAVHEFPEHQHSTPAPNASR